MNAIGVDIGGVVIARLGAGTDADTSFRSADFLATDLVDGALDGLRALHERFDGRVYLVSKAGVRTEHRTRRFLQAHDLTGRTGVPAWNVWFCRRRPDKAEIATELGLTHFVDDRLEVLGYLDAVPHRLLFRPDPAEVRRYPDVLPAVTVLSTWPEVLSAVDRSIPDAAGTTLT